MPFSYHPRRTGRRLLGGAVALGLLAASCSSGSSHSTATTQAPAGDHPNVVFILTDDMAMAELQYMPHVQQLIGDQGATFDNYFISDTECCPSRTTTLRGQYSHNTGVHTNTEADGGFETAHRLGIEDQTVATQLQSDGYRTALYGKYLNGYPHTATNWKYVPPGWTEWASPIQGAISEFNYTLNHDGAKQVHGSAPEDYAADVYTDMSLGYAGRAVQDKAPFFLYYGFYAPHSPSTPAPRHENDFPGLTAPRTASFDEQDTSDKPAYVQALSPLPPGEIKTIDTQFALRVRSLQAVDDSVVKLVGKLKELGQLDNTYIVFTSDNGYHLGQHRLPPGKGTPYEEDIKVPMFIRGPGITPGTHVSTLTGNVDLASTFEDMAGAKPLGFEDGRSMLPLAKNQASTDGQRQAYLLEHWPDTAPEDEAALRAQAQTEPSEAIPGGTTPTTTATGLDFQSLIPKYSGIRTQRYALFEFPTTGEHELYDLQNDPAEMQNVYDTIDPTIRDQLTARLHELETCQADQCRQDDGQATP